MKKIILLILLITFLSGCYTSQIPIFEQKYLNNTQKSLGIISFQDVRKDKDEPLEMSYFTETFLNISKASGAFTNVEIVNDTNKNQFDFILKPTIEKFEYSENMSFFTAFLPATLLSTGIYLVASAQGQYDITQYLGYMSLGLGVFNFFYKIINKQDYNHTFDWRIRYQLLDNKLNKEIVDSLYEDSFTLTYSHGGLSMLPVYEESYPHYKVQYYEKYDNDPDRIRIQTKIYYLLNEISQNLLINTVNSVKTIDYNKNK